MLSIRDIQQSYIELYTQLRKYIWPFHAVELLAELEIETYKTFPSLDKLIQTYNSLEYYLRDTASKDAELRSAMDAYSELINSNESTYVKLNSVQEVIQNEDN